MSPLETRPARLHRYGYLVVAALCALGLVVTLSRGALGREALVLAIAVVISGVVGWGRLHERLVVADDGLTARSLWTTHVRWDQIGSYRLRDTSDYWTPTDLPDLLLWPFVLIFRYLVYFPTRLVVRWVVVRKQEDRRFLDAELTLLDAAGKKLLAIAGADRHDNVAEAIERIVERLHSLPLPPFAITDGKDRPIELGSIAELDVGSEDTRISTVSGARTVATSDLPNPFLVIEAVHARGGHVTVAADVFLPRALRAALD